MTRLEQTKKWLHNKLKNGPLPVHTVISDATNDGISEATLRRAKDAVVHVHRDGNEWYWDLKSVAGSMTMTKHVKGVHTTQAEIYSHAVAHMLKCGNYVGIS